MATPAPMDSGRYFWLVRLVSCLKRIPDCCVTSANTGRGADLAATELSNRRAEVAASARNRKDRRSIFKVGLSGVLPEPAEKSHGSTQHTFSPSQLLRPCCKLARVRRKSASR